jgi:hypothetical protein
LFNLLAALTFFLPKFRGLIFGQDDSPAPDSSPLIRIICKLITTELGEPSKGASQEDLGRELLGFLEAMCFELPDEDALKYVFDPMSTIIKLTAEQVLGAGPNQGRDDDPAQHQPASPVPGTGRPHSR